MMVHPHEMSKAKNLLDDEIEIIEFKIDDCWARDSGAIFLLNDKKNLVELIGNLMDGENLYP